MPTRMRSSGHYWFTNVRSRAGPKSSGKAKKGHNVTLFCYETSGYPGASSEAYAASPNLHQQRSEAGRIPSTKAEAPTRVFQAQIRRLGNAARAFCPARSGVSFFAGRGRATAQHKVRHLLYAWYGWSHPTLERLSPPNDNVLFVPSRNVLLTALRLGRCKKDNY